MKLYYRVDMFNERGEFDPEDMLGMIAKKRRHFFVFFPRVCNLNQMVPMQRFLSRHKSLSFCIHDKNFVVPSSEANIGRNLAFYTMLSESGARIENVSFHMGSLVGFGRKNNDSHVAQLMGHPMPMESNASERFLIADFRPEDYVELYSRAMSTLKNIASLFDENEIDLLVKNFSVDNVTVSKKTANHFIKLGYLQNASFDKGVCSFPVVIEKGDFPKTVLEMFHAIEECDVGISLDMEHLNNVALFSQKYNLQNGRLLDAWNLPSALVASKAFVERYGFFLCKGAPIFYPNPIDPYTFISKLQKSIEVVHLSGNVGPVFLDKPDLGLGSITSEVLMGQLEEADIPFARQGKEQEIQVTRSVGFRDQVYNNFRNVATQEVWRELFEKQFLESILIFKEIGCKRIVQKVKSSSEMSIEAYELFDALSEMED